MSGQAKVRLKQTKSGIGYSKKQRATLRGLGFRRMQQVVELENTPAVQGMIKKVNHLVEVMEVEKDA